MARSPIEIALASETKAFKQGIESGVIKPLEDAIKQLRELGDTDGADKLEASLKDAQRATERLGDETKITAARIEREYRDAYRAARRASDDGLDGMKAKGEEVSNELKQNLGETFSSFRGDLQDLPQIAQDTLGGLAGSGALGGIGGLAATAAGAAGLGLIIGAMDTINEHAEALQQRAGEMASAFIEAGSNVLDATSVAAATADVITDPEKRKQVQEYVNALGVDFPTAARAYVGDQNAMATVDAIARKAKEENIAIAEEQRRTLEALSPEQQRQIETNSRAMGAQRELTGIVAEATAQFRDQQGVLNGLVNDAASATEEVDALGNRVLTLPDGLQIMISAETGQATTNLTQFKGDLDGVAQTVVNPVIRPVVDTSEWDRWEPQLKRGYVAATLTRMGMQIL